MIAAMRQKQLIAATVICLALIVYATLVKMSGRPVLIGHHEANWIVAIERFSAYGLLGFLLAFLFPGRLRVSCALVVGVAAGLELLQALSPDRDAALFDVFQKASGGITGVIIAQAVLAFLSRSPS